MYTWVIHKVSLYENIDTIGFSEWAPYLFFFKNAPTMMSDGRVRFPL